MLENAEPRAIGRVTVERPRPKLGPFLGVIDEILVGDRDGARRSSATRPSGSSSACATSTATRVARSGPALRRRERPPSPRGVRAAQPAAGRSPVRLRRGDRRDRRGAGEGGAGGDDAAVLGRVLRLGLSARVHRDLPSRPRRRVRVLRRRADQDRVRQHDDRGQEGLGGPNRELTTEFLRLESHFLFTTASAGWRGATRRATSRTSSATAGATSSSRCRVRELRRAERPPDGSAAWRIFDRRCAARRRPSASGSRPTGRRCWRSRRPLRAAQGRAAPGELAQPGAL